jgi:hypothetical protein
MTGDCLVKTFSGAASAVLRNFDMLRLAATVQSHLDIETNRGLA